jgi:hypothetical protein
MRACGLAEHGACSLGAKGGSREPVSQRGEVRAGVDVEQEGGWLLEPAGDARGERECAVALTAAGPKAGRDRIGREEQQAVGAGAMPVGHHNDLGSATRAGAEQRVELRRIECGAVAGNAEHALKALSKRVANTERNGSGLALVSVDLWNHERALSARGIGNGLLAGDDDRALDRVRFVQGKEHVGDHRARELQPQGIGDGGAKALLGASETLDGQDRGGAHIWARR